MSFMQVRDILKLIRGVHRRTGNTIANVLPQVTDDRSRNVLETLLKHNRAMALELENSECVSETPLMQTWIQYTPDREPLTLIDESTFTPDMEPDDVLAQSMRIDRSLIEVYRLMSEQSSAPTVIEFFEQLESQTGRRLMEMSWRTRDGDSAPRQNAIRGAAVKRRRADRPTIAPRNAHEEKTNDETSVPNTGPVCHIDRLQRAEPKRH